MKDGYQPSAGPRPGAIPVPPKGGSGATPSAYRLNTTLQPVAAGVLAALAAREDLKNQAANQVLERLLREELERILPGAWDELVRNDARTTQSVYAVKERVAEVAEAASAMLAARHRDGGAR